MRQRNLHGVPVRRRRRLRDHQRRLYPVCLQRHQRVLHELLCGHQLHLGGLLQRQQRMRPEGIRRTGVLGKQLVRLQCLHDGLLQRRVHQRHMRRLVVQRFGYLRLSQRNELRIQHLFRRRRHGTPLRRRRRMRDHDDELQPIRVQQRRNGVSIHLRN